MAWGNRIGRIGRAPLRWVILIAVATAAAGVVIWAVLPRPERELKRVIQSCRRIIESKDVEPLRPYLAQSFYYEKTGDRDETVAWLKEEFRNVLEVKVHIRRMRFDVRGRQAGAVVDFNVSGSLKGEFYSKIPFRSLRGDPKAEDTVERCRLLFVREDDGQYRISSFELLAPADGRTFVDKTE